VIEGYIGRPGSGKTYTLTERVIRSAKKGVPVFTNYPVAYPGVFMFRPDQLLELPPGLIVIDEAHLWFPARLALKLPPSWLAMLSQTRKNGWDLLWSAQHEKRVDVILRDVSNLQWLCKAWFEWGGHPLVFTAASYEPETFRKPKSEMTRTVRFFSRTVSDAYDTMGRLDVAQHVLKEKDVYREGDRGGAASGDGGDVGGTAVGVEEPTSDGGRPIESGGGLPSPGDPSVVDPW
jgi:hypothetical protein